ncbi:hypothetical protein F4604DRAFT_1929694 [Suillus subluteus]|nr:hypothetical protein F4604DRAFT_1929694 [Suillus subluteus]
MLKAEAGRHIKMVALKNNLNEAQHENPVILSLSTEIGSRGPTRLISLWKKCCFGYLVQANMLDPVTFNFSALVSDRITLARQQETRAKKRLFQEHSPLGIDGRNSSPPTTLMLYVTKSSTTVQALGYTLACTIVILQHAFSADWNWADIRAFDPFYSLDLANNVETANFFDEVISITSDLVASWDVIFPQVREIHQSHDLPRRSSSYYAFVISASP